MTATEDSKALPVALTDPDCVPVEDWQEQGEHAYVEEENRQETVYSEALDGQSARSHSDEESKSICE